MKALQFSLTESILQISSTIFTVSNMDIENFNETNEDVFFLLFNSFNDFYESLTYSSELYINELMLRADDKKQIGLILFILAIVSLTISFFILIPVVLSVNKQKDKVLSLFCEIDNNCIRVLSMRCERFINNMQAEEANDEIQSNDDMENVLIQDEDDDEYSLVQGTGKRQKKAKGKTQTDLKFFLKFGVGLLAIMSYYLSNHLLANQAIEQTEILASIINVTAFTEPYYWFALNTQREMMYDPSKPVLNQYSTILAKREIIKLFDQYSEL
mmetsp:Transcript_20727/g.19773  ORF Transcript_20727/g.19773 Transcript_20727/m.19773 type:complete len:271 (+) Transcript_20727:1373-2185(+)